MNHKPAFVSAVGISALVIGLFYYWFAVANRYVIFLYKHLGAVPFDQRTASRYWMSGLVASGIVLLVYGLVNWVLGRVAGLFYRSYVPPDWWQVWGLCMILVSVGIVWITTTRNQPTLPLPLALLCTAVLSGGLALALYIGSMTAQSMANLTWLLAIGAGLTPCLLLLRAIELPATGLLDSPTAYWVAIGGTVVGIIWSMGVIWLRPHLDKGVARGTAVQFLLMAFCLSYLVLPVIHYFLFTPAGARYITVSANFFALSGRLQWIVFFIAALLAVGFQQWQTRCESLNRQRT